MRSTFVRTLTDIAAEDPRVVLLTGDLGFMVIECFADRFPERFWNVGVAEQNMVGLATGMAEAGFVPFTYSMATFSSLRPYEFIRNGPVHHRLPVRIVGVGGGFEYGSAGPTHHGVEDIALMRVQPGLTVIAPADHQQTATALHATWDIPGPIYFRLGKDDRNTVPGLDGRFELGRAQTVRGGDDAAIVVTGAVAANAVAAAELLSARGVECTVMVVASICPPPIADLVVALGSFAIVVTVEAHSVTGGLGSLVSEVAAEHGLGCRVLRCGVRSGPDGVGGGESYLNDRHGLSPVAIANVVQGESVGS